MKILYLYSEIMGYTQATLRALAACDIELHLVHWDNKKLTPFVLNRIDNSTLYNRSEYDSGALVDLVRQVSPDLAVVSGWMDKGYLKAAKSLKRRNIPVVAAFDTQWKGTLSHVIASLLKPYFRRFFTHAWVPGLFQYDFARRLGFRQQEILFNLYSCDSDMFAKAYTDSIEQKTRAYPHRFVYIGRFEQVKGLELLAEAWEKLGDRRRDWELHLIGQGTLATELSNTDNVIVHDFLQPDHLAQEMEQYGCFILPSLAEPWGVVIHEMVTSGLPVICTRICGAASSFVIDGYNGYVVKEGSIEALSHRMLVIIDMKDAALLAMAHKSHLLSKRITPEISAASLLSLL